MRVAVIDVGTNTIHLVVSEVARDGSAAVVEAVRHTAELGRGADASGLAPDATARALDAIRACRAACDRLRVDAITTAATSAVRDAANGVAFCERVAVETGIRLRVVTGEEEARLVWLGVRREIDLSGGPALLVDLGGGSVELVSCDATGVLCACSLPLGHIRMTERLPSAPTGEAIALLRAHVRSVLAPHAPSFAATTGPFVGTSGPIRTLARLAAGVRGDPVPSQGQGLVLARAHVEALLARATGRAGLQGLDPRRRATVPAAAAVVAEVMTSVGREELVTSEHGLREGLLADWIERHLPAHRPATADQVE